MQAIESSPSAILHLSALDLPSAPGSRALVRNPSRRKIFPARFPRGSLCAPVDGRFPAASHVLDGQPIAVGHCRSQVPQSLGRFIAGVVAALGILGAFLAFIHAG